jgi:hypothetical protein
VNGEAAGGERETDVVVTGTGPGGEYAAGKLAEAGLEVAADGASWWVPPQRAARGRGAEHADAGDTRPPPVTRLREMIYAFPAFHRAVEAALADLG